VRHYFHEISVKTSEPVQFVDITERVREAIIASGISEGIATVFSRHTTSAVKINERCDRLQQDMKAHLENVVPSVDYSHDEDTVDDRPNARGHLMSMMLGASETIPVNNGSLALGGWQSVFFVELDGPRAERKVFVKILGE
jgi:secondary thiamine-phosphate synthase enzyme